MTPLEPRRSRNAVTMRPTNSSTSRPTVSPSIVWYVVHPARLPSRTTPSKAKRVIASPPANPANQGGSKTHTSEGNRGNSASWGGRAKRGLPKTVAAWRCCGTLWGRGGRPPRHDHRFSSSRRTCSRSASMPDGRVQHDRRRRLEEVAVRRGSRIPIMSNTAGRDGVRCSTARSTTAPSISGICRARSVRGDGLQVWTRGRDWLHDGRPAVAGHPDALALHTAFKIAAAPAPVGRGEQMPRRRSAWHDHLSGTLTAWSPTTSRPSLPCESTPQEPTGVLRPETGR